MGFQQALSGLSASSTNLDVIGNNVANSSTVGFKEGRAEFADMFANALNGSTDNEVGLGTRVTQTAQSFSQGTIQTTSNPLDTAINGNGFFRVDNSGTISYSRDGQLQVDKNGYLVNSTGAKITGYSATSSGTVTQGALGDIQITSTDLVPAATANASLAVNLNANATVPTTTTFDPTDSTSYNQQTSMTVYDSLGDAHTMTTYYQLQASTGTTGSSTWNVYATLDGNEMSVTNGVAWTDKSGNAQTAGQITFNSSGAVTSSTPATMPFTVAGTLSNGATSPLSYNLSLKGSTEFGTTFSVNSNTQDGYAPGQLTGFSLEADGTVEGTYSNGHSQAMGQVVLANFADPNGLQATGNNAWTQTVASGEPVVGTPNSGSLGSLQSSALEQSNVDLTTELVNMIVAQRAYQANAETIKTEDQMLQTITSLR